MPALHFASDNNAGVCTDVLDAITAEASISDAAYGSDRSSARMTGVFGEVFERPVEVFCVPTGTAANSIALAAVNPVWGGVICHKDAHIVADECAAPTVIGSGLTLLPVPGDHGRLSAPAVAAHLDGRHDTGVHSVPATGISITQATEVGTLYAPDAVASLAEVAHERGMTLHMDGARFSNAVAAADATAADLTWRAGVDIMSFGATKGGALGAEAVVLFTEAARDDIERLRKRTGHLLSKMRFAATQFNAWLSDGTWLHLADHANTQAARLAGGLHIAGVELVHPVEANIVFARLPTEVVISIREAGAEFYEDSSGQGPEEDRIIRLVASWATTAAEVDAMVAAVSAMM